MGNGFGDAVLKVFEKDSPGGGFKIDSACLVGVGKVGGAQSFLVN
jgi:hypothetical protein